MKARYFIVLLVAAVCIQASWAQAPTGTIVGRVLDPVKAVVPDATITVRNVDTNEKRRGKTGSTGEYTVPGLLPGNYEVAIEKAGFSQSQSTLQLAVDQIARLDVTLTVGRTEDRVVVTAEAPLINTESSVKGAVVATKEIEEIPLNGRDFNDLVFTVPGIQPSEEGSKGSPYVANGSRADSSNVVVDGVNDFSARDAGAQARPPLDSIEEFKVQTNGYSAQYGRLSGSVVTMALKRGGNAFHGSLYEYVRNDMFDGYNYFDDPVVAGKSKLRQNQFGTTFSGPVILPRVYDGHNKTFFFFTWESQRQRSGSPIRQTLPTALEMQGDFSQSVDSTGKPIKVTDPLTKKQFPGNIIPQSRWDPASRALLAFIPAPNAVNDPKNNYHSSATSADDYDSFVFRVDHQLTTRDSLAFQYLPRSAASTNPTSGSPLGTFGSTTFSHDKMFNISETRVFTNALVNDLHFGLTRTTSLQLPVRGGTNWAAKLGIPGLTSDPELVAFPSISMTGYATLGDSKFNPIIYTVNSYDLNDVATWVKGAHTIKFGGQILRTQYFQPTNTGFNGSFSFKSSSSVGTGYVPSDLLLGILSSSSRTLGTVTNHIFAPNYSLFVQDSWKLRPNLTLDLGMRWEIQTPPYEQNGQLSSFVPSAGKIILASTPPNMAATFTQNGFNITNYGTRTDYGLPFSLVKTHYNNFSPRVGFAWRPFTDSRTVVNGGYGIFYTGSRLSAMRTDLTGQFPFSIAQTFNQTKTNAMALVLSNPFPDALLKLGGVVGTNGWDPTAPSPYVQAWNLGAEREIGKGVAVQLAYTGSKGTHLGRKLDINQYMLVNGGVAGYVTCPSTQCVRPASNAFSTINEYVFKSSSVYHAATATVKKEYRNGLSFRFNYTYGKSIDDASGLNYAGNGGNQAAQNSFNLGGERARSDFDRRHVFSGNLIYRVPFHNIMLRGWQIVGSGTAYSGAPFTVMDSGKTNSAEPSRPNRTCGGLSSDPTAQQWFDTACFASVQSPQGPSGPVNFLWGNSGRNILSGPNSMNINTAFSRNFKVRERDNLQFRWEVFNVLNHPNFRLPNSTIGNKNFGTITKAGDPRVMQFAAIYRF